MSFWQRLLAFESYIGFQHDTFGIIVALDLWVHGSLGRSHRSPLSQRGHRPGEWDDVPFDDCSP